ncbi:MAG: ABC transporter substrate-binding protein [Anaerovoracaceae bacterium]
MKKKVLALCMTVIMTAAIFTGCGTNVKDSSPEKSVSADTTEVQQQSWTFTDQADNEVTVQVPVKSMVVLQHHSIDIIAQLGAQDKVVGVESGWAADLGDYMKDVFPGIEKLPTPGDLKSWNVEEIATLKPDIVIAASQADEATMQKVKDLGIPVAVVSLRGEGKQAEAQNPRLADADAAYTEGCKWAVETLGKLTGTDKKADELWSFCEESRKMVDEKVGDIEAAERIKVFIANENSQTYGNDKYVGCMLLRAGGINVAAADIQGYQPYTFEQLANWNPDVIIVQDRYKEVYDKIMNDAQYKTLKAVKDGKVILAPYWTKPWGNPDADSIALGELWMAHQLYPDKISTDVVTSRAKSFYDRFYNIEFTDTVK